MTPIERLKRIEIASRQIVQVSMQAPTRDGIVICAKMILHDAESLIAELSPPLQSAMEDPAHPPSECGFNQNAEPEPCPACGEVH